MPIKKISTELAKIANAIPFGELKLNKNDWHDGIVIRPPNWLGDAVMALPAIKTIRKAVPKDCAVFVLSPQHLYPLFSSIDCVDRALPLHNTKILWTREDSLRISQANFGVALLFNASFRDTLFFRYSMPLRKIYAPRGRLNSIFLSKSFDLKKLEIKTEKYHHASKYLSIAYSFGAEKWDEKFPIIMEIKEPEITDKEIVQASKLKNYLILAPGAAYGPAKKWDPANFATIGQWWIRNQKAPVIILGTNKDIKEAIEIEKSISSNSLYNLVGKTDLYDLIRLLKNARFCISNDSGIMHLAAALSCPGVAIFGSTNPYATSPLSEKWVCLYSEYECSPCLKRTCKKGSYDCLKEIKPAHVIEELSKL